jgi:predicted glutamine amidotransferase
MGVEIAMCGIAGVLSFTYQGIMDEDYKTFMQLWKASLLRGEDGAGVFWVGDKESGIPDISKDETWCSWIKMEGIPFDVINSPQFEQAELEMRSSRFLLGHCRAKTTGDISADHAHPFEVGHITMVHNGTLSSINGMDDFNKYATDSLALAHALAEGGNDPLPVLKRVNGAAAIVWYNSNTKTLHVYRNHQRPLSFAREGNKVYIASESMMLSWILSRSDLNGKYPQPYWFDTDTLYTFTHRDATPTKTRLYESIEPVTPVTPSVTHIPALPAKIRWKQRGHQNSIIENPLIEHDLSQDGRQSALSLALNNIANVISRVPDGKERQTVPAKQYGPSGSKVTKGDIVVFEPMNLEYLTKKENCASIIGVFQGVMNKSLPSFNGFRDVQIRTRVQRNTKKEISDLYAHKFIRGRIESITVNTADITDVTLWLSDVRGLSDEEIVKLIKMDRLIDNNMTKLILEQSGYRPTSTIVAVESAPTLQ